jgi:hypothetical protein
MKDIVLFSIYTYYTLLSFCLLIKYLQNSYMKRLRLSETGRSLLVYFSRNVNSSFASLNLLPSISIMSVPLLMILPPR